MDKYGFVAEVPSGPTEQTDGFLRNIMGSVFKKSNPALWADLDRLPPEEMLKSRLLKPLIRECGIPEPLRTKVQSEEGFTASPGSFSLRTELRALFWSLFFCFPMPNNNLFALSCELRD